MPGRALETSRLTLLPWEVAHTDLLARLGALPDVMRHVGTGEPWSRDTAEDVAAAQREHWARHGFGWRAARERATGELVGFVALSFAGAGTAGLDPGEYELGWWLDPAAWGRGLAREGAGAVVEEAFGRLGAPSVVARIQPANRRSLALARALGFELEFTTTGRSGETLGVHRLHSA